jgi:predicted acylesterase/phospholipase RssA
MSYAVKTRDQHLAADGLPKRILALDGGGLRGILTLGILARIEALLRERHGGGDEFRLAHYFDLIAGTSTGAIIAAALAQGWSVAQVLAEYRALGNKVFQKSFFRQGLLRAKYDEQLLSSELQRVYGRDTTLGSTRLMTGVVIVTKRLDTGSPWPVMNNPRGRYFKGNLQGRLGNGEYPLWQVVRASTAAPMFFDSETLTIAERDGSEPVRGEFVDGGVSPFNNPALQALMAATLDGYRIGWPTGADKLMLVSLGTGAPDFSVAKVGPAAGHAISALMSLMNDCATLQQTLLQWMSTSSTARVIDRELGDLRHDLIAPAPLISYLRYDVDLRADAVRKLDPDLVDDKLIASLSEMDAPENMDALHALGRLAGERDVNARDFPSAFDLPLA